MQLIQISRAVAIGGITFAASIVVMVAMTFVVYGSYEVFDSFHRGEATRRVLAEVGLVALVVPAVIVLFGIPLMASRKAGWLAVLSFMIAGALAGIVADHVLFRISLLNDCLLDYSYPRDISGCS